MKGPADESRMYDAGVGRFTGVDPLAHKFSNQNPYHYVLNNPVSLIDPTGMEPEWIPSVNMNGQIILTAEAGDNSESLSQFFGGKDNGSRFVDDIYLSGVISYSEGDQVKLNDSNVFSQSMSFYFENRESFENSNNTYDCKEACASTTLENPPLLKIESRFKKMTPSRARDWGNTWNSKEEVQNIDLQFGRTFSVWNWTSALNLFATHAAVFFGKDNFGEEYFFTKNGNGPLDVQSFSKLNETYYLPNWTRNNYKKWKMSNISWLKRIKICLLLIASYYIAYSSMCTICSFQFNWWDYFDDLKSGKIEFIPIIIILLYFWCVSLILIASKGVLSKCVFGLTSIIVSVNILCYFSIIYFSMVILSNVVWMLFINVLTLITCLSVLFTRSERAV